MNNTAIKLTYQDYLQITDDLNRHEIIDGEHYVTPSPITKHQRISKQLFLRLNKWVEDHHLGEVYETPLDVVLSDIDVVVPDLLFVSKSRMPIFTEKNIHGAPDLVIEILSPSTASRDLGIKKRLYEKHGVKEYWIVDPDKQTIAVFTLTNGKFSEIQKLTIKNELTSSLFPGLKIPISSVFV
ncbi:MAG: Uma2 family endonuclease [Nitrospirae bacterium]|nr:Uma2 family endonuclease [Nitrospirota bacterium]MBI3353259.1 Uma2 family endonuclease [Nitrospirota bacterium]